MAEKNVRINIDGASKGNPGAAGAGAVLYTENGPVECAWALGITTNNVAEYSALLFALQEAIMRGYSCVEVFTDSQLLARQVTGEYKVRNAQLRVFFELIQHLIGYFDAFSIAHIPREENAHADKLANRAVKGGQIG